MPCLLLTPLCSPLQGEMGPPGFPGIPGEPGQKGEKVSAGVGGRNVPPLPLSPSLAAPPNRALSSVPG